MIKGIARPKDAIAAAEAGAAAIQVSKLGANAVAVGRPVWCALAQLPTVR